MEDLGEKEYLLYRLDGELTREFNTHKVLLLKTMYTLLEMQKSLDDISCQSVFGTNSFHMVWEKVLGDVLGNQIETRLRQIKLPRPVSEKYEADATLKSIIERPKWTISKSEAKDTFIPDIVTITKHADGYHFNIYDAKYYVPKFEKGKPPEKQPGIESVTKEYFYQLAYKDFIEEQGIFTVKNYFLMPIEGDKKKDFGRVEMDMFRALGLSHIEVVKLPAEQVFELYLSGKAYDLVST